MYSFDIRLERSRNTSSRSPTVAARALISPPESPGGSLPYRWGITKQMKSAIRPMRANAFHIARDARAAYDLKWGPRTSEDENVVCAIPATVELSIRRSFTRDLCRTDCGSCPRLMDTG